jgi:hypothetical protein
MTQYDATVFAIMMHLTSDLLVLCSVAVRVTNEDALPVVVELAVRDSHTRRTVGDVEQAIVEVLVVIAVRREIDVVNPYFGSRLDTDGIASLGENLADLEVADDHVAGVDDPNANADQGWLKIGVSYTHHERCDIHTCSLLANDRGVCTRADDYGTSNSTRDHNDLLCVAEHSAGEGCQGRDRDRSATRATSSARKQK